MAAELDNVFGGSRSHLIYALIAIACPFIAGIGMHFYQQSLWAQFASSSAVSPEDMLPVALFIDFVLAVAVGSLIGMIFAVVSLWKGRRWISLGTVALLFNAIPVGFVAYMMFTTW